MRRIWKWLVTGRRRRDRPRGRRLVLLPEDRSRASAPRSSRPPSSPRAPSPARRSPASTAPGPWHPATRQNFVGYRVTEKLFANISETEATGRTDNVDRVDDDRRHDGQRRDRHRRPARPHVGQQLPRRADPQRGPRVRRVPRGQVRADRADRSSRAVPAAGETITTEATGEFTLHGVTKRGDHPARRPLGRQAGAGRRQPADRVRRLRHHARRARLRWPRSTTTADGAPALLQPELSYPESPLLSGVPL